jgi:hypothetical protein
MLVDIVRDGYKYRAQVPDDAAEHMWQYGVVVGPPDLTSLDLPADVQQRLHNELFNRGLITSRDVRRRSQDVFAALQAALKIDAGRITQLYLEG